MKEKTPFEKFHSLAQGLLRVPKSELDKKLKVKKRQNKAKRKNPK